MAKPLNLNRARSKADILHAQNKKEIEDLYKRVAEQLAKDIESTDSSLARWQMQATSNQINNRIDGITKNIEDMARGSIQKTAQFVVDDVAAWTRTFGINFKNAYTYVPTSIVEAIATGSIYEGNWNLSAAIWGHGQKIKNDLMTVIAEGFAQSKSVYDIAKDVERYMNPADIKNWDWNKVYPGTNKVVDYNAQRLVRTVMQHAFQQSFIETTYRNPFVTKYRWLASGGHRMCEICAERDGKVYEKDELPMDHPNGMCTYEGVIEEDNEAITDRLASWVNGNPDPELEEWYASM